MCMMICLYPPSLIAGVHSCSDDVCLNGGSCLKLGGAQICSCPPGYTGEQCELGMLY